MDFVCSWAINLCYVWNTFKQQNSDFLLSKPLQLKSLELINFRVIYQPRNNQFFEDLLNYFQHIQQLKLHFVKAPTIDYLGDEQEADYMPTLVQAIGHQLYELRNLYLGFAYDDNWEITMTLCDNLFTTLCDSNEKLEILHLNNILISDEMLLDLCHHPKLHTLSLSGFGLHNHLTKDGWISFARKLKERWQSGYGGIRSILLSCSYRDDVTDEVLEELAGVKSLKSLQIENNRNVTDAGINKFASIKRSSNNNHMKVELYGCDNVSLGNPYVVFVPSPFEMYMIIIIIIM